MELLDDIHRMTVAEYARVAEELDWDRTELVEGVVYDVAAEYNRHRATVMRLLRAFDVAFPRFEASNVGSVQLSRWSMVQPDVFLIRSDAALDPDGPVPADVVPLIVEVGVSTFDRDITRKVRVYAAAGVTEVWVIDPRPTEPVLVRHRDPDPGAKVYRTIDRVDGIGENAADLDPRALRPDLA